MAINFPDSPTSGNTYTDGNGVVWKYDGTRWAQVPPVDDTPVDAELEVPVSSNWAYDHENAADPHTGYVLESNVDDTPVDAATTDPISSNWAYDHENASDPHTNYVHKDSDTGSASLPAGTTAQRTASPGAGDIRFNTTDTGFEGHDGTSWGSIGGGATGAAGSGDKVFWENDTNVTTSYTITSGQNAMSAGPITIDDGATVTVPDGSVWTIV